MELSHQFTPPCPMPPLIYAPARLFAPQWASGSRARSAGAARCSLYVVIQLSMSRRALARSGQRSAPISVLIVANDSAAAPSRQEPVRLVLWRISRRRKALR